VLTVNARSSAIARAIAALAGRAERMEGTFRAESDASTTIPES
jgi:hypothetical protein